MKRLNQERPLSSGLPVAAKHNGVTYLVVKYYPHRTNSEEPVSPLFSARKPAREALEIARAYRPWAAYSLKVKAVERAPASVCFVNSSKPIHKGSVEL